MAKPERIRDPVHDLIMFDGPEVSQLEGTLWKVLQTRPFQRLRRIRQLGFSELVYPGATHSRFAHSVGVFHTARQLMDIVRKQATFRQDTRENHALAAALVHDVGHGPFSHAFEKVGARLGLRLAHHETLSETLIRNGEIAEVLNKEMGKCFADDVADILKKDGVQTVHHAVVSSQFDADRLDYIRRDRMMTGSQHAGIDFRWLLANLQIDWVPRSVDDVQVDKVQTFVIAPKAVYAAEAFVLGLFQLYPTVYYHKATRGMEKLFEELLVRIVTLARDEFVSKTGLPANHPLIRFALKPGDPETALLLDDTVVAGAFGLLAEAEDLMISRLAIRIRDRKLFKCVDIREIVSAKVHSNHPKMPDKNEVVDKCCALVKSALTNGSVTSDQMPRVLLDEDVRTPYKDVDKSKGPLNQIMVRGSGGLVDLKDQSQVVSALQVFKLFRAYHDRADDEAHGMIINAIEEAVKNVKSYGK